MNDYAVGIPTRDRPELLAKTLEAFAAQTQPPGLIFVIDNNTGAGPDVSAASQAFICDNEFGVAGPEQAHQTALRWMAKAGVPVGVRWDDDLVPEPDCMERLVRHIAAGNAEAAGGCYPRDRADWPVWPGGPRGGAPIPDGHAGHAQFFRWAAAGEPVPPAAEVRHLYSGFAYRVGAANDCGGFCTGYTQLGYRAETDLSLRIGRCLVEPSAVAVHHCAPGGVRSIAAADYERMAAADASLFAARMTERGIDIEGGYWQ